ncbi:hypothetical protein F2Q69_00059503 [Brassica cretica]|uniref:Uncharacterized protein n=1 Tax=Brassica cretica TaxID=69181 RepID=A0A8S9RIM9_BRACR|nr:hypothetical protein F2Q69_00059503 [Brassica cretica]
MVDFEDRYSTEKASSVQSIILYGCDAEALSNSTRPSQSYSPTIKCRCHPELVQIHGFRSVEVLLDTPLGSPKNCPEAKGGSVRVQISPSRPVSVFMMKPRLCPSRDQSSPVKMFILDFGHVLSDQPAASRLEHCSCVQMANRGIGDDGRGRKWGEGMDWTGGGLGYRVVAHASGAMRSDTRAATRLVSDWLMIPINSPRPPLISTHPEHFNAVFENSYSADFESSPEEGSVQLKIIRVPVTWKLDHGRRPGLTELRFDLLIVEGLACLDMTMHNGPSYRKRNNWPDSPLEVPMARLSALPKLHDGDGSGVLQRYENLGGGVYALGVENPDNAGPSSGPITGSCVQMDNRGIGDDGRGRIWGEGMDWIGGGLGYRVAAHASGAMRSDTRAATRLVSDWLLIPINSPRPPLISTHPEHFNAVFENSYSADFESAPEEGSVQLKIIRVKISSRNLEVGSWQEVGSN